MLNLTLDGFLASFDLLLDDPFARLASINCDHLVLDQLPAWSVIAPTRSMTESQKFQ